MEVKTSKMLRSELVTLEFQVQQSVGQACVDRVGFLIIVILSTFLLCLRNFLFRCCGCQIIVSSLSMLFVMIDYKFGVYLLL